VAVGRHDAGQRRNVSRTRQPCRTPREGTECVYGEPSRPCAIHTMNITITMSSTITPANSEAVLSYSLIRSSARSFGPFRGTG
jgi:hypothetical protein